MRSLFLMDWNGGGAVKRVFYFFTGFGHLGVVIFFVLSGFLVGRKLRELAVDPDFGWQRYLIDRFSRIFIVLWPAILLSVLALGVVMLIAPHAAFVTAGHWSTALNGPVASDLSSVRWLGLSVLVNNELTLTPIINGPLWSLESEWVYYVVGLACVIMLRRKWSIATLVVLAYAALIGTLHGIILDSGAAVWCLGLLASVVSDRGWLRGRWTLVLAVTLTLASLVFWRLRGAPDIVMGLMIAVLISPQSWRSWSMGGVLGDRLAGFSYSLYVIHFPLCVLAVAIMNASGRHERFAYAPFGLAIFGLVFCFSLFCAWAFSKMTEGRTYAFKRWLSTLLPRPSIA